MLMLLQLRGSMTAEALAAEFEVSVRTIYRDADQLSAAGVPIYADRGPGGGFKLLDGWRTHLTGMTPAEAEALIFAGLPVTAGDLGLGAAAAAAHLKFLTALPAISGQAARRIADRFHFDPSPWHRRRTVPAAALRTIAQAVWEARRLRLVYESWTGSSSKTVEPLGIVLKAGEWYFVANRRGRPAIHRLDKATSVEILPQVFARPSSFDLGGVWRDAVADFETTLRRCQARLRVHGSALSRLDLLGADITEPVLAASPDENGVREATVSIEDVQQAAGLLLGFAASIEVIWPSQLRQELRRRAMQVVALYSE